MDDMKYREERPWLKWLISAGVGLVIVVWFLYTRDVFSGELLTVDLVKTISDGFFISGVLLAGTGLLIFCSRNGTFDMLTYGVKTAIRTIFKTGDNESFYDYKQRLGEKITPCAFLIVPGMIMLAVAAILVGVFYKI